MRRIYIDAPLQAGHNTQLQDTAFHYLFRVLRCKHGEQVCVFNGDGNDYIGTLQQHNKKSAEIILTDVTANTNESSLHSILFQGLSKGERMDIAIQKAVELGVNEIYPVQTEFSAVKLNAERQQKKYQHWQAIIQSACEQSERAVIPTLHPIQPLIPALGQCQAQHKIMLHPYQPDAATPTLLQSDAQPALPQRAALLIGPEGGLSDHEVDSAKQLGFTSLQLGSRILRTETATISALSLLQYVWGDYAQ